MLETAFVPNVHRRRWTDAKSIARVSLTVLGPKVHQRRWTTATSMARLSLTVFVPKVQQRRWTTATSIARVSANALGLQSCAESCDEGMSTIECTDHGMFSALVSEHDNHCVRTDTNSCDCCGVGNKTEHRFYDHYTRPLLASMTTTARTPTLHQLI